MSHHTQLLTQGFGGGRPREDSIYSNCSSDSWLRCAADNKTSIISSSSAPAAHIITTTNNAHASAPSPSSGSSNFDLKLFIKDVHDKHGRKRPLSVKPWASIKDVKDLLANHLHVPPSSQRLYFGPLINSARELPNHRTLMDAGIYRNGETLLLEITGGNNNMMMGGGGMNSSMLSSSALSDSHSISSLRTKANDVCVSSSLLDLTPKSLQRLVQQARRGLALGFKPSLAPDGSGGSYFLCDARKKRVGVFKPADEEPFSENNPRGYVPHDRNEGQSNGGGVGGNGNPTESLRQGIRPGELCLREVAAFILDHDGFSDVPMTTLAEAQHPALHVNGANWTLGEGGASVGIHSITSPLSSTNLMATSSAATGGASGSSGVLVKKVGSFQEYVYAECTMDDLSPSKISVEEVHKIAILDIRIMNADRNVANIMCQRIPEDPDHFKLIPIDHGYSLRSVCDVAWFDWCWLDWPQTKVPLGKKARDYVLNLDIDADARLLKERLGMSDDVLDYFRVSCKILKSGVKAGLTLYEIASGILCRTDPSGE
jgi:phosphatidylinositol 4-kinase type 2